MTRQTFRPPVQIYLGIVAVLIAATALFGSPQEPPSQENKDKNASEAAANAEEQARREAERVIRGIEMEMLIDDKWTKVERIEKPLLFYSEPTRNNDRGSVWGWGRKGRPVALVELFQDTNVRTRWVFALCNTSGGKIRASRAGAPWWRENDSASELKDVPSAGAPAAEAPLRQRQLKLLAQKFTGHQFWDPDNSRYELRLLKRPLCTYRDEPGGVLEGGLFTLANGTNPEILLFIEARVDSKNSSKHVWQYTVGRLAHAELHLEYDGKEVFEAPRANNKISAPDQPYWCDYISLARDAGPREP
jgi:hypothetical protein